jgi:hypothetical protein
VPGTEGTGRGITVGGSFLLAQLALFTPKGGFLCRLLRARLDRRR